MCLIIKIRFYRNFLLPGPLDNLFCCCCNISSRQQVPLTKKTFSTLSHFRGNEQQVNCYSLKAFYIIEYFCFFIFLVSMYFSLKLREVLILDEKECLKSVCYNDFMILWYNDSDFFILGVFFFFNFSFFFFLILIVAIMKKMLICKTKKKKNSIFLSFMKIQISVNTVILFEMSHMTLWMSWRCL